MMFGMQHFTSGQPGTFASPARAAPEHPAFCDYCQQQIVGVRYRCSMCANFDLCQSCIELSRPAVHDTSHLFLRIEQPTFPQASGAPGEFTSFPSVADRSSLVHNGVTCSVCSQAVIGVRYECQKCFGYNLCEACEAKGAHDLSHPRLKHTKPVEANPPRQVEARQVQQVETAMFGMMHSTSGRPPSFNPSSTRGGFGMMHPTSGRPPSFGPESEGCWGPDGYSGSGFGTGGGIGRSLFPQ